MNALETQSVRRMPYSDFRTKRLNAQVIYWSEDRGYGFLDGQDGRVYFHVSDYAKPEVVIREGQPTLVCSWGAPKVDVGNWINYLPASNAKGLIAQGWCFRQDWEDASVALAAPPPFLLVTRYWTKKGPVADPRTRTWVTIHTLQERVVDAGYDVMWMVMPSHLPADMPGVYQNRLTYKGEEANHHLDPRWRTLQDWFDLPVGTVRHQVHQ